jgi:hypothetical protein
MFFTTGRHAECGANREGDVMTQEYVRGFIIGQDSICGQVVWKIRVQQKGHPLDGKKCRVATTHEGFVPKQSQNVRFVLGSAREGGQTINLAYDVSPATATESVDHHPEPTSSDETMNWFVTEVDGKLHVSCLGFRSVQEAQEEMGEDEKVVAFIPFDISEHVGEYDDPDMVDAFILVQALQATTPTMQALERLITVIVRETLRQTKTA